MLMRTLLSVFVWGFLLISPALSQNYLTTDDGEKFFDDQGGFILAEAGDSVVMPAGGKVHSVIQLATWGEHPSQITISLYLDVQPDKTAIRMSGFAQQDGTTISNTWYYLNGVIIAQCPSPPSPAGRCDYMLPVTLMRPGQNEILFAFQAPGTLAFGEKINVSKP